MAEFKRKTLPAELTEALRSHASGLPSATGQQAPQPQPSSRAGEGRARPPKTVQLNMNVSEDMARLVAKLAKEAGSTRRLFARLLKDAGHDVPEADLNPADNRRRWEQ
jgi:hypothetical protein